MPDHSTISQLRRRKPSFRKVFRRLFEEVARQCIEKGLVSGRLAATDSTHVKANASRASEELVEMPESPGSYWERLDAYEEKGLEELERRTGKRRKKRVRQIRRDNRRTKKRVSRTDPEAGHPSGDTPEHTAPEKLTVLVVEPMKEPYVKEIDPGLHALQAEVGGDITASYPFDDPVGLVLNDEGKLIGLDLNRSLRDEHGEIYDIVAGTFLVVGLGEESFTSLPPELAQKYMEHFKQPEQFINLNGQIVALPVEPENPLRTAEMTLEDDYGMIDGIINNGRRGEELEKAQDEARRTTPEKKPSIRERLEDAKRECGERKPPDKAHQKKPPEHDL